MDGAVGFALEIGITVAVTTIGGLALGKFLDSRFGWTPFGLLVGALLGIAVAITVLIIRANKLMK